jgi:hypothetical protein
MTYQSDRKPLITCYSSDYEHSVKRWFATRRMVEEAGQETDCSGGADEKREAELAPIILGAA